jgi:signal transduction histidine kinase
MYQTKFEQERIEVLNALQILDTLPEQVFDDITYLASVICDVPIALISLVDEKRQFFKSHFGLDVSETPREYSFCAHAILKPEDSFLVENAHLDERFKSNPLVTGSPNIAFYFGIPIVSEDGYPYGTLCVIDKIPRILNEKQIDCIKKLTRQVENIFILRSQTNRLKLYYENLNSYTKDIEDFSYMVAHDLKGPTKMIAALVKLLQEKYNVTWDADDLEILEGVEVGSKRMEGLIDSLLEYGKVLGSEVVHEDIMMNRVLEDLIFQFKTNYKNLDLKYHIVNFPVLHLPKIMLQILFQNLISNAIKYRHENRVLEISVDYEIKGKELILKFQDNGIGIPESQYKTIFKPFKRLNQNKADGHGLGLAFCKKIIVNIGGSIEVESVVGKGTTFVLTLPMNY